jgi:hypothetical protein
MLFRLGFSHESVEAILLWGFAEGAHWMGQDAVLMNADGSLNAAGKRITHLLQQEWSSSGRAEQTDENAAFRGFYGTYEVTVTLPDGTVKKRDVHLTKTSPAATVSFAD